MLEVSPDGIDVDGDVTIDNRNRLRFADSGTDKAVIGIQSGLRMYMGSEGSSSDPRIRFDGESSQAAIEPTLPAGSVASGASGYLNLGSTTSAFKEIHLTDGVVFGDASGTGTSTSNTLDSYEEGTWTPSFTNLTIGNGTVFGTYTKIGRSVTVVFGFDCGSTTSVGTLGDILGLPFTASNDYTGYIKVHGVAFDSGSRWYEVVAVIGNNSSNILVPSIPNYNSSITSTSPMPWTTNDTLVFTATYTTT